MCLVVTCWERACLSALICGVLLWVCYFPIGILGQVWYLIVSIPDLCTLYYFYYRICELAQGLKFFNMFLLIYCYLSIWLLTLRLIPVCTFVEVSKRWLQVHCLIAFIPAYWSPICLSPRGRVLWYFHTYVGSGHFLGVQNYESQYFWGFSDNLIFFGVWRFLGYFFGVITKLNYI